MLRSLLSLLATVTEQISCSCMAGVCPGTQQWGWGALTLLHRTWLGSSQCTAVSRAEDGLRGMTQATSCRNPFQLEPRFQVYPGLCSLHCAWCSYVAPSFLQAACHDLSRKLTVAGAGMSVRTAVCRQTDIQGGGGGRPR